MFQFLQPIWLFALAGISVPIIIHFWNQRPGKVLKVGSLSLVTESNTRYKRKIQLSEIVLLILRCLFLACIAMALSAPVWKSKTGNNSKGWVLINRQELPATYQHFKPTVDSLLAAGFEFHFFEDGFAKGKMEDASTADSIKSKHISYRDLVALLNEKEDAKLPVYIFSNNYLRNFTGNRKTVSLNLHWFMYTAAVSPVQNNKKDTAASRITIFSRHYTEDVRYLQAALHAIQTFSKKNIDVKIVSNSKDISSQQDWLFYLDEDASYDSLHAKNVLTYATGKPAHITTSLLPADAVLFSAIGLSKLIIEKQESSPQTNIHWADGFGHPVLTSEKLSSGNYYRLYTHIDPSWNEVPWDDQFPAMLYKLIYPVHAADALGSPTDQTIIDSSQAMPLIADSKQADFKTNLLSITKLANLFWLLVFVLFFMERSFSFQYYKSKRSE